MQNKFFIPTKVRIVDYLEASPKKCFYSVYNYFSKEESVLIALKNINLIKKIVELWENRENKNETFEEFKKRIIEDESV